MTMIEHLVLIGINYRPARSTGDKNFWFELIPRLCGSVKRITILSLRQHDADREEFEINGARVTVRYIQPRLLKNPDAPANKKARRGVFPRGLGVAEKVLSVRGILKELRRIRRDCPYQHVHLMDNFGIANRVIAARAGSSVSVSAIAYQPRGSRLFYDAFLRLSFGGANTTVVPYSRTYSKRLVQIGVSASKVVRIPWGLDCANSVKKRANAGVRPLILWAGYIQQIQRDDFFFAYRSALAALGRGLKADFFFAFKPESFENGFEEYDRPDQGVRVRPTTVEEFAGLREKCDIFFSPIVNAGVIVAPPLTWLEVMASGVPVVTTPVEGADETVMDGVTGFLAESEEGLADKLFQAVERYKGMRDDCIRVVRESYDMKGIADSYITLWRKIAGSEGSV